MLLAYLEGTRVLFRLPEYRMHVNNVLRAVERDLGLALTYVGHDMIDA